MTAWMKHFQGNTLRACGGCGPWAGPGYPLLLGFSLLHNSSWIPPGTGNLLPRNENLAGCLMCENTFAVQSKCRRGLKRL